MVSDELAEAERRARLLRETDGAHYVGLPPILDELVRLRAVEKAAAALVEYYDDPAACVVGVHAGELLDALTDALNGDVT